MKIKPKKTRILNSLFRKSFVFLACLLLASITNMYAQTKTITGKVTDSSKEPLIGVTVKVQGTTTGTITDLDGMYSLSSKSGDVLEYSYVGMKTKLITVSSQSTIDVLLEDDATMLSETVVIGYGSAKAKDLTSPIATIKSDEISKHLTASPMQGLQGKIPGLQVINSGEPGKSPKVRIRGIGNYDSDKQGPLFVVDGMFFDNIDFLNNNDIENISVLKDASSSAIYGVRAANGVVIVTTKKGYTNSKPRVTYDGFLGIQRAQNVVKMANTADYAAMMNEIGTPAVINEAIKYYGGTNGVPAVDTDWFKEILRTAPMHSHSVNVDGGGEKTSYTLGVSYLNQDGILNTDNGYERINVRTRVDMGITNWLKAGGNVIITNSAQQKGNMSAFGNAYTSPALYLPYDQSNVTELNPRGYTSVQKVGLSTYYWNPVAMLDNYNQTERIAQVLPSFYIELSFLENKLTFKSSFNQSLSFLRSRKFIPKYSVNSGQQNTESVLEKKQKYTNNWVVDNILTYRDSFLDKHNVTMMVGNSFRRDRWEHMYLEATNIPQDKEEYWYIHQGVLKPLYKKKDDSDKWIDNGEEYRGASYFGRLMYDYAGKYLLSATLRADGSSKYQEKWGYFPSVGLGWVVTEEDFMKNQKALDFLKLRASWGILGNDKIAPNAGFSELTINESVMGNEVFPGTIGLSFFNNLKWERVEEIDFGLDFATLNNRLTGEFDYYKRTTKNAVFSRTLPFGAGSLRMNNGEIENSGVEVSINWNDKIGKEFDYNVGFNMSTLKNKATLLDGLNRFITEGDYARIRQVGLPIDSYFGYKVIGVYQNQAEVDADQTIRNFQTKPKPGDLKYADIDGNGVLTDDDRTDLGSPLPKLFIGGNIGFNYKSFDFSTAFQGQFGHKLLNQKRFLRQKQSGINFDKDQVENRWTGEGSTNTYPSAQGYVSPWINKFNSFFVESANTFTIQNIQLGYTFQNIFPNSNNKSSLRLSITAERPFSFYKYNGFTTDIEDGIDNQMYPMASTYSFGIKLIY